ncbi:MAG: hypothetical protein JW806_06740 [Sedimentisphaerales bacterium]|nr:hypothetical protein [Sedimentisphaerales bacterium]
MRRTKNFLCAFLVVVLVITHFALAYHGAETGTATCSVESAGQNQALMLLVPEHVFVVILGIGAMMLKRK